MRLVCPNCDAKYEVPEDAIPETGRDVQCANCGHAWYQMRPRSAEAAPVVSAPVAAPASVAPAVAPEPEVAPEPAPVPEPVPEPVAVIPPAEPEPEAEPAPPEPEAATSAPVEEIATAVPEVSATDVTDAADLDGAAEAIVEPVLAETVAEPAAAVAAVEADAEAVSAVADPVVSADAPADPDEDVDVPASTGAIAAAGVSAYAVDESVLAILREEAEREAQARKADTGKPLETQPDLGIDAVMSATRKPVEAVAVDRVSGDETAEDRLAGRRTRLPDVEEINSTLRPSESGEDGATSDAAPVAAEGSSSFRSGFLLVLTVAILGSALYSAADAISHAVPALEGPLSAYVSFVNSLRLHLDGLMQSATVAINGN